MGIRTTLRRLLARTLPLAILPATVAGFASLGAAAPAAAAGSCQLNGPIKHVINLVFDNVHFHRDRANVPSDLEQMPNLLNFLTSNGTLLTNNHTILISHTAGGILTSLTGLYPDRNGQTVSNSYDYFKPDATPTFTSSFKYWTDKVDVANDPLPNMITDGQKTTPAPWVPFTRAGCDVGGVGTANIELENNSTGPSGDMTRVFGVGSDQWNEANNSATKVKSQADFVGIAIHCTTTTASKCASNPNAKADPLSDEPGGYNGFQALYGAKYVNPAITNGGACVNDTDGAPVTDPAGNCGFPGFDGMLAKRSLGYVAQMQEAGVPITYAYISDAHDNHALRRASGPGEADYVAQLKAYDDAFAAFFSRLQNDGITKANTLFVITADEGDHFAGGIGTPQADGTFAYSHSVCTDLANCPTNQIGELLTNLNGLLPSGEPAFDIHFDSSPAVYVNGKPGPTDTGVRKLEHDIASLTALDPYVRDASGTVQRVSLTAALADPIGEKALHMINSDPNRTPTFTWFANPDFFFQTFSSCGSNPCANPGFAWNHGDIQPEIVTNWLGMVGPGVQNLGLDGSTWSDHTDIRATVMALTGLKDDYAHDGRVLVEDLTAAALPLSLRLHLGTFKQLAAAYKQINAPVGHFGVSALKASTTAIEGDDRTYTSIENQLTSLTNQRNTLASQISAALEAATFNGQPLNVQTAQNWIAQAQSLLNQADALAAS